MPPEYIGIRMCGVCGTDYWYATLQENAPETCSEECEIMKESKKRYSSVMDMVEATASRSFSREFRGEIKKQLVENITDQPVYTTESELRSRLMRALLRLSYHELQSLDMLIAQKIISVTKENTNEKD